MVAAVSRRWSSQGQPEKAPTVGDVACDGDSDGDIGDGDGEGGGGDDESGGEGGSDGVVAVGLVTGLEVEFRDEW